MLPIWHTTTALLVDQSTLDTLAKKSGSAAFTDRIDRTIIPPTNSWITGMVLQNVLMVSISTTIQHSRELRPKPKLLALKILMITTFTMDILFMQQVFWENMTQAS